MMYIYTASICNIILNPNCPTLEVSKAAMELRLKKFRVSIDFILLFKKLNLLNKFKIRTYLMKKVKLSLAIQRLKKRLTFLAKINLPMIMKMKRGKTKTNSILILNRMMACLIYSGNYFDLFYFWIKFNIVHFNFVILLLFFLFMVCSVCSWFFVAVALKESHTNCNLPNGIIYVLIVNVRSGLLNI